MSATAGTAREVRSRAPIRGAQSFVAVMTEVWSRPSLTGLEVCWRWAAGAPILGLAAWRLMVALGTVHVETGALEAMTVFKPVAAFGAIHAAMTTVMPAVRPVAMWLVPMAAAMWVVIAAVGRTLVMRRFDATLHARTMTVLWLGVIRAAIAKGCATVEAVGQATKAGTNCGSCKPEIGALLAAHETEMEPA